MKRSERSGYRYRIAHACIVAAVFIANSYAQEEESTVDSTSTTTGKQLEEVIVTASYREQNIQDVVGGIQLFDGDALDQAGADEMQDYLDEVPGVSLQQSGTGTSKVSTRGISNMTGIAYGATDGSPTTAVYVNDIAIQGAGVFPDLNLFDLNRIEMLKGPQGTLYGEGSMGGAIKLITNRPDTTAWALKTSASYSNTNRGGDNYDAKIALNVPLWEEHLAVRAVATKTELGGYVDYINRGEIDPDEVHKQALRVTALWSPLSWLEIEYGVMKDEAESDALSKVSDQGSRERLENAKENESGALIDFELQSLVMRADFKWAQLVSITGLFDTYRFAQSARESTQILADSLLDPETRANTPPLYDQGRLVFTNDQRAVSQELRLISQGDNWLDWSVGLYYRDREQDFYQQIWVQNGPEELNPTIEQLSFLGSFNLADDNVIRRDGNETFEQKAAFGEVYIDLLTNLELTVGLRWFEESTHLEFHDEYYNVYGVLFLADPNNLDDDGVVRATQENDADSQDTLKKISLAWHLSDEHMVYATVGEGFRSATPNISSFFGAGRPILEPDTVLNKEIGAKTTWLDRRLIFNAALFHIDWNNIQLISVGPGQIGAATLESVAFFDNGGDGVVYGGEMDIAYTLNDYVSVSAGVARLKSELTDKEPQVEAEEGTELPSTPELTYNIGTKLQWPLWGSTWGYMNVVYNYVDEQMSILPASTDPDGLPLEAYELFKAQMGLSGPNWDISVFGDNLTDERVITSRLEDPAIRRDGEQDIIRPRTVGLRINYQF